MAEQQDLTQGNLVKTLLLFALPYIGANFLQALYGAADLFIVGKFCDSSVVSAVATGSQLLQTLIFSIWEVHRNNTSACLIELCRYFQRERPSAE